MKPFDLEKALAGKEVVTRDGREAKVVFFSEFKEQYPVLVVIKYEAPQVWMCDWFTREGSESFYNKGSGKDLFMSSKTKKLWVAVSKKSDCRGRYSISDIATTKEEIEKYYYHESHNFIEIEIEE